MIGGPLGKILSGHTSIGGNGRADQIVHKAVTICVSKSFRTVFGGDSWSSPVSAWTTGGMTFIRKAYRSLSSPRKTGCHCAWNDLFSARIPGRNCSRAHSEPANLIASFQKTMSGPIKMPGTGVLLSSQKHKRCTRSFHDNSETVTCHGMMWVFKTETGCGWIRAEDAREPLFFPPRLPARDGSQATTLDVHPIAVLHRSTFDAIIAIRLHQHRKEISLIYSIDASVCRMSSSSLAHRQIVPPENRPIFIIGNME